VVDEVGGFHLVAEEEELEEPEAVLPGLLRGALRQLLHQITHTFWSQIDQKLELLLLHEHANEDLE